VDAAAAGPRSRFLDGPLPLAFAHRGGAGLPGAAENTVAAFGAAVALGCTHLETDVRATADGVAVLCHDETLDRLTAGERSGPVGAVSWAELSRLRVGGREPFARLDELLDALPDALVNVDVKHDAAVGPFLSAVRRTGAADRIGVASFSPLRAGRLRRSLGPSVAVSATPPEVVAWLCRAAVGPTRPAAPAPGRTGRTGRTGRPVSYQVPERARGRAVVTARTVAAAHRAGRHVHVWTVDDAADMDRLLDAGVDGIVTDRPDVLLGVLHRRAPRPA